MSSLSVSECHKSLLHGLIPAVPVTFATSGRIDAAAQERARAIVHTDRADTGAV